MTAIPPGSEPILLIGAAGEMFAVVAWFLLPIYLKFVRFPWQSGTPQALAARIWRYRILAALIFLASFGKLAGTLYDSFFK